MLTHHVGGEIRLFALPVLADHAVIPDERKRLNDDLPVITGIGQRFDISRHARREYQFPDHVALGSEAFPFEHPSVL